MKIRTTLVAILFGTGMMSAVADGAIRDRSLSGGRYFLELNGTHCGYLSSFEGGDAVAPVISERVGNLAFPKKRLGPVSYEPITVKVGNGMCTQFYNWLRDGFGGTNNARVSGAIVAVNENFSEVSRMAFTGAVPTELAMPALDAASKDPAVMTIKFRPEVVRRQAGTGARVAGIVKTKQWLPSSFRIRFGGDELRDTMMRVNKVDPLVLKQTVADTPTPTPVEVSNLGLTLAESHAAPLYTWHEAFVVQGKNGEDKEKAVIVEYLSSDLKTVLFTVALRGVGIFKLAPEKATTGGEGVRRVRAELYAEQMQFSAATVK